MPAFYGLRIYFHIVGKDGSVYKHCVVEEDSPGQYNSDEINVWSPGELPSPHITALLLVLLHPQFCEH